MHTTKIKQKSYVDFLENAWESKAMSKEYRFRNSKSVASSPPSSQIASAKRGDQGELNTTSSPILYKCKICKRAYLKLSNLEKHEKSHTNSENGKKSASKKSKKSRHASKVKEKLAEDTRAKQKSRTKKHSQNTADEVRETSTIGSSYSTANFHNIDDLISQPQGVPSSVRIIQSGLYPQEVTSNLGRSELENTNLLKISCPQNSIEKNKSVVFFQPIDDPFQAVNISSISSQSESGVFKTLPTEEEVHTQVTRILDLLNKEKPTDADSTAQGQDPENRFHDLAPVALKQEKHEGKHSQMVTQAQGANEKDESDDLDDDTYDAVYSDDNISDLGDDVSRKPVETVWESIVSKTAPRNNDKFTKGIDLHVAESDETEKRSQSNACSMDKGQDDKRQGQKIKLEGSDSEHELDNDESYIHEHNDSGQEHGDSEPEQVYSDDSKGKGDDSIQEHIDSEHEQDSNGEKNESNLQHADIDKKDQSICSKLYWCSICHEEFDDSNTYKVHKRKHVYPKLLKKPEDGEAERPSCDVCGKVFKNRTGLSLHRKIHSKKHQCEKCQKVFNHPSALRVHLHNVHDAAREHICEVCGKAYLHASNLHTHRSAMHNDATVECKECGKVFQHQSNLKKHMRVHFGEKSFVCECCGKAFKFSGPLHRHMRIHKNEKSFECVTCGRSFRTNYNLTVHMRTHTMEKPYRCSICKEGFNHNVSRKAHMQKCHS